MLVAVYKTSDMLGLAGDLSGLQHFLDFHMRAGEDSVFIMFCIALFVVVDNETILATKPKQSVKWIHSWVNQFGKAISPGQSESISTRLVKKN